MTLNTIANIAEIASAATVIFGILFGVFQLSEFRAQRRSVVAADLMRNFYSADLANAVATIRSLPDDCSPDDLRKRGDEFEKAAVLISTNFETMGLMAFERIAPLDLVEKLAGGVVVVMWHKLRPWLERVRQEQSQPSWAEWFQWLAQQCERRKTAQEPAYTKHKDWQP
jgi:hypothetical protein